MVSGSSGVPTVDDLPVASRNSTRSIDIVVPCGNSVLVAGRRFAFDALDLVLVDLAHVGARDLVGRPLCQRLTVIEPRGLVAERLDEIHAVRDQHDRDAASAQLVQVFEAATLELLVADGDHLVDDQDLRVDVHRDREAQAARTCRSSSASPACR